MSIVRVGSNAKYADGWETAFKGKRRKSTATAKKTVKTKAATSQPAKKAAKKSARKKSAKR